MRTVDACTCGLTTEVGRLDLRVGGPATLAKSAFIKRTGRSLAMTSVIHDDSIINTVVVIVTTS